MKTVDTTGAGDAFVGALLCNIVDDQSVIEVTCYHNFFFNYKILYCSYYNILHDIIIHIYNQIIVETNLCQLHSYFERKKTTLTQNLRKKIKINSHNTFSRSNHNPHTCERVSLATRPRQSYYSHNYYNNCYLLLFILILR